MRFPKIILSDSSVVNFYPALEKLISSHLTEQTCLVINNKFSLPYVNSDGVMFLSLNNFHKLYPILKSFLIKLKEGEDLKKSIKELKSTLTRQLNLTEEEVVSFTIRLILVLIISRLEREGIWELKNFSKVKTKTKE